MQDAVDAGVEYGINTAYAQADLMRQLHGGARLQAGLTFGRHERGDPSWVSLFIPTEPGTQVTFVALQEPFESWLRASVSSVRQ